MTVSSTSSADAGEESAQIGLAAAYEGLTHGRVSEIDSVLSDLDRRLQQQPDDGYAHFYAAAFRLWKLSEDSNSLGGLLGALRLPDETIAHFERAQQLMPDDFRVPGFFGLTQLSIGTLTSDEASTQRGLRTLDRAIELYPAYGYFLRATATSGRAKDDPLFATTIGDMERMAEACLLQKGGEQVAYLYPDATDSVPHPRVCSNAGIVPHVWEGTFISFGDIALKSGVAAARVRALYRTAQASPAYATWPFARMLEQRIQDVETNAALYADTNPFNDPPVWAASGHICVGCHQER
jgi:tetratricopeptide (TPR) repeat protein